MTGHDTRPSALFRAFTQIMLAFGVRHAGEEAAAALSDTAAPR